jgi:2-keto-4-pentenoate hydratase
VLDGYAERLWRAATEGRTIPPLTEESPQLDLEDAYAIQDQVLALRVRAGEEVAAAKLGLTSRAKQVQVGVDEPLYGWLTDTMRHDPARPLDLSRFAQPRVEPEVAFVTGADLAGPGVTSAQVLGATAAVAPALDVLDSRFAGYKFSLVDVTADDASAAGYILGEEVPLDGDLRVTGCVLEKNGELVDTAAGAAVMEHPAAAVAWFVRKLHTRGRSLPAGSVVLAGAWTAAIAVAPGDTVRASFDRVGSVEVTCR